MASRYKLTAPAGGREYLALNPQGPGKVLASWETQEREPQELELLCYPLFAGEPGILVQSGIAELYGNLFLDLQLSLGAGELASSVVYSTTGKFMYNNTDNAGPDQSFFTLPHNGVRVRFCARAARLVIHKLKNPAVFVLATSFTPIRTAGLDTSIPRLIPLGFDQTWTTEDPDTEQVFQWPLHGTIIPKGARECRVISSNPLAVLAFYPPGSLRAIAQIPVSELSDWRPFSGRAYSCGIRFADNDWPSGGLGGELYEVEFR